MYGVNMQRFDRNLCFFGQTPRSCTHILWDSTMFRTLQTSGCLPRKVDVLHNLFLTAGECSYLDLGMESGSIPGSKINASTVQSASTPANNSRLNFASGSSWCAGTGDSNPYLQIDLQTLHIICAVSTQGNSQADQWVKNYILQSSIDGSNWRNYTEIGQVKVIQCKSLYFHTYVRK